MITWTIEAVFQNGVFRPLTPVMLPENACVTLVLQSEEDIAALMPAFGQMDENEWTWTAWAGSLGDLGLLVPSEQDEG